MHHRHCVAMTRYLVDWWVQKLVIMHEPSTFLVSCKYIDVHARCLVNGIVFFVGILKVPAGSEDEFPHILS